MTGEQDEHAQRVARAKHELRESMRRMPKGIADAGSTRVQAYKQIMHEAEKLLNRAPMDPAPYVAAKLSIDTVMTTSVEDLVQGLKGWS